eukprot:750537-Hanusia_phi.AAC.4
MALICLVIQFRNYLYACKEGSSRSQRCSVCELITIYLRVPTSSYLAAKKLSQSFRLLPTSVQPPSCRMLPHLAISLGPKSSIEGSFSSIQHV